MGKFYEVWKSIRMQLQLLNILVAVFFSSLVAILVQTTRHGQSLHTKIGKDITPLYAIDYIQS